MIAIYMNVAMLIIGYGNKDNWFNKLYEKYMDT